MLHFSRAYAKHQMQALALPAGQELEAGMGFHWCVWGPGGCRRCFHLLVQQGEAAWLGRAETIWGLAAYEAAVRAMQPRGRGGEQCCEYLCVHLCMHTHTHTYAVTHTQAWVHR